MAHASHDELFARCAAGFEGTLATELRGLGLRRVRPLQGGASFYGSLEDAYRACLWSRVATRVQLVLARIDAHDADALYDEVAGLPWEDHVAKGATIAVTAHGTNPQLRNTQFTALKVKDALCDRLRSVRGTRPDVDPKDPDFALDVSVHERRATVYLNLSGPSLHRRGYREPGVQTEAPLKETLAAGILLEAGWDELARQGAVFADPMCGSGTLAIEAALIALGIAPGALRTRWGFQGWTRHDEALWERLVQEAALPHHAVSKGRRRILAGDVDPRALGIARANAERAGVAPLISFEVADAASLEARLLSLGKGTVPEQGLMATNPPYGHRLQSAAELPETYAALARAVGCLPEGWRLALITPDTGVDTMLGQKADRTSPCFNGPLRTTLRISEVAPSRRLTLEVASLTGAQREVAVAEHGSEQYAARLRKAARERAKWARKKGVSCYRVYDADLPDYALSVDLYQGSGPDAGRSFVRMEEHPAPASVDADRADRRFADALALTSAVLDVERDHLYALPRPQADGARPPAATGPALVQVVEEGHAFELNLAARKDTGLALEHRATRALLGSLSSGTRFLSIGSYAGAPAVYAAAGGAAQTMTVDGDKPFLAWARRTMETNGFTGFAHRFELAEPLTWLERTARTHIRYDLAYCDLSAFAGSAGDGRRFDAPRDHVACLEAVAAVLAPGATLLLTSSLRQFKLDYDAMQEAGLAIEDISAQTIPHDFSRTPKIHRAWLLKKP